MERFTAALYIIVSFDLPRVLIGSVVDARAVLLLLMLLLLLLHLP